MFLYSIYCNEGSTTSRNPNSKFNELREGKNPKAIVVPNQTISQWGIHKTHILVNQKWEKLRNLY